MHHPGHLGSAGRCGPERRRQWPKRAAPLKLRRRATARNTWSCGRGAIFIVKKDDAAIEEVTPHCQAGVQSPSLPRRLVLCGTGGILSLGERGATARTHGERHVERSRKSGHHHGGEQRAGRGDRPPPGLQRRQGVPRRTPNGPTQRLGADIERAGGQAGAGGRTSRSAPRSRRSSRPRSRSSAALTSWSTTQGSWPRRPWRRRWWTSGSG